MLRYKQPLIVVNGLAFGVRESAGLFKADLGGIFGWVSVWADSRESLVTRVKAALRGGQ